MRLDDLDPSSNVRDLGEGGGGGGGLNLLGFLPLLLGRGLGCGTIGILAIVAVAFLMFSGGGGLVSGGGQAPTAQQGSAQGNVPCDTAEELFACRVLASTEQVWGQIFRQQGQQYPAPTLNFFRRGAQSGCGAAQSAMGPFYCPPDRGVYLDTSFFRELSQRFGAGGDFAQAYVVAHEVGHHIQNLTGQAEAVSRAQQTLPTAQGNAQSVRLELQADCYAGVWGKRSGRMESGDLEEGLKAAEAIGDDTLQGSNASPESFTHGTSAQRRYWLNRGYQTGDPAQCDTFSGQI
ncbi:KPN_02809 family neutral zinc metallopeptidase [Sphingomonas sp. VNH70]|uniref:KPN_02809 family neutral zinc metallopeptidase n=1 Tax=Sphingomonas silueang TaxID=3156617 RepID=UPI0032B5F97A